MTQLAEAVAIAFPDRATDECAICGKSHGKPKAVEYKEVAPNQPKSKWGRKKMDTVFKYDGKRETIYPGNKLPKGGNPYEHQGHHCLALSAFVHNAHKTDRTDRFFRLNHFLHELDWYPNRDENCIGLPAKPRIGAFENFWKSVDIGKPLQMHGPTHHAVFFAQTDRLISQLIDSMTKKELCDEESEESWKDKLKELIAQAENYAFKKSAAAVIDGGWCLHPREQKVAIDYYSQPATQEMIYTSGSGRQAEIQGYGKPAKDIVFPDLDLDTGPFGK